MAKNPNATMRSPRRPRNARWALLLAIFVLATAGATEASAGITTFDPAGSIETIPTGVNADGVIAGHYEDTANVYHGFVRAADGTITSFDPVGSVSTSSLGINRDGVIAGYYEDSSGVNHGFVRAADGTITSFDAGPSDTYGLSINKHGDVVGDYAGSDFREHGFVRAANGTIVSFDAGLGGDTHPASIASDGTITGIAQDNNFLSHGFVRAADGTVTIPQRALPILTASTTREPSPGSIRIARTRSTDFCAPPMEQSRRSTRRDQQKRTPKA